MSIVKLSVLLFSSKCTLSTLDYPSKYALPDFLKHKLRRFQIAMLSLWLHLSNIEI